MNGATTTTGSAAAVTAGAGTNKHNRRLVLHFDINKTIVMKDTSNNLNNTTLTVTTIHHFYIFIDL